MLIIRNSWKNYYVPCMRNFRHRRKRNSKRTILLSGWVVECSVIEDTGRRREIGALFNSETICFVH
jgi:hypothetical protein